jgi:hypothetical protein
LGRVVEEGEPVWLPDDRDVVDMWLGETAGQFKCGHFQWEEVTEGFELGYKVCKLCAETGPYEEKIRRQNRERGVDEHGLTFGWFPPEIEESDGN